MTIMAKMWRGRGASRAEKEPVRGKERELGLKGLIAIALIGVAGIGGIHRGGEIDKIKDRIDYSAKRAEEQRQITLGLKKLKCQDAAGVNTVDFSVPEAKTLRRIIPERGEIDTFELSTVGWRYAQRTNQSKDWSEYSGVRLWYDTVDPDSIFDIDGKDYQITPAYFDALTETIDETRHLDLDASTEDESGRLPIENFRKTYERNARSNLTEAIETSNDETGALLQRIDDLESGYIPIPGIDHVLSGGELPGIGQLSDDQGQRSGIDMRVYDQYDKVYGVPFEPVNPRC